EGQRGPSHGVTMRSIRLFSGTFVFTAVLAVGCDHDNGKGNGDAGAPHQDAGVNTDAGVDPSGGLVVTPADTTLTITRGGPPQTGQLMAARDGQSVNVTWSVDRGELGGINSGGLFTTTGKIGGVARITATDGEHHTASATVNVRLTASDNGDPDYV